MDLFPDLFHASDGSLDLLFRQTVFRHLLADVFRCVLILQFFGHLFADDLDFVERRQLVCRLGGVRDDRAEGSVVIDACDAEEFRIVRIKVLEPVCHVSRMPVNVEADIVKDLQIGDTLQTAFRIVDVVDLVFPDPADRMIALQSLEIHTFRFIHDDAVDDIAAGHHLCRSASGEDIVGDAEDIPDVAHGNVAQFDAFSGAKLQAVNGQHRVPHGETVDRRRDILIDPGEIRVRHQLLPLRIGKADTAVRQVCRQHGHVDVIGIIGRIVTEEHAELRLIFRIGSDRVPEDLVDPSACAAVERGSEEHFLFPVVLRITDEITTGKVIADTRDMTERRDGKMDGVRSFRHVGVLYGAGSDDLPFRNGKLFLVRYGDAEFLFQRVPLCSAAIGLFFKDPVVFDEFVRAGDRDELAVGMCSGQFFYGIGGPFALLDETDLSFFGVSDFLILEVRHVSLDLVLESHLPVPGVIQFFPGESAVLQSQLHLFSGHGLHGVINILADDAHLPGKYEHIPSALCAVGVAERHIIVDQGEPDEFRVFGVFGIEAKEVIPGMPVDVPGDEIQRLHRRDVFQHERIVEGIVLVLQDRVALPDVREIHALRFFHECARNGNAVLNDCHGTALRDEIGFAEQSRHPRDGGVPLVDIGTRIQLQERTGNVFVIVGYGLFHAVEQFVRKCEEIRSLRQGVQRIGADPDRFEKIGIQVEEHGGSAFFRRTSFREPVKICCPWHAGHGIESGRLRPAHLVQDRLVFRRIFLFQPVQQFHVVRIGIRYRCWCEETVLRRQTVADGDLPSLAGRAAADRHGLVAEIHDLRPSP